MIEPPSLLGARRACNHGSNGQEIGNWRYVREGDTGRCGLVSVDPVMLSLVSMFQHSDALVAFKQRSEF
jgi:hypothetical protein